MKVKFLPDNVEFEIKPGQSVMDLAHEKNVYIKSICNGLPSCSECRVRVVEGDANVLPPSAKELNLIGTGYFIDQRRLSCQLICFGDVVVDLTEQTEKQRQGPRRLLGNRKMEASNAVSGNLIEQDAELKQMMTSPPPGQQSSENTGERLRPNSLGEQRPRQPQQQQRERDPRRDQHSREGGNRNQNQNQNRNQGQNQNRNQQRSQQQRGQQQQGQSQGNQANPNQGNNQGQQQNRNQGQNRPNKSYRYKPGQN